MAGREAQKPVSPEDVSRQLELAKARYEKVYPNEVANALIHSANAALAQVGKDFGRNYEALAGVYARLHAWNDLAADLIQLESADVRPSVRMAAGYRLRKAMASLEKSRAFRELSFGSPNDSIEKNEPESVEHARVAHVYFRQTVPEAWRLSQEEFGELQSSAYWAYYAKQREAAVLIDGLAYSLARAARAWDEPLRFKSKKDVDELKLRWGLGELPPETLAGLSQEERKEAIEYDKGERRELSKALRKKLSAEQLALLEGRHAFVVGALRKNSKEINDIITRLEVLVGVHETLEKEKTGVASMPYAEGCSAEGAKPLFEAYQKAKSLEIIAYAQVWREVLDEYALFKFDKDARTKLVATQKALLGAAASFQHQLARIEKARSGVSVASRFGDRGEISPDKEALDEAAENYKRALKGAHEVLDYIMKNKEESFTEKAGGEKAWEKFSLMRQQSRKAQQKFEDAYSEAYADFDVKCRRARHFEKGVISGAGKEAYAFFAEDHPWVVGAGLVAAGALAEAGTFGASSGAVAWGVSIMFMGMSSYELYKQYGRENLASWDSVLAGAGMAAALSPIAKLKALESTKAGYAITGLSHGAGTVMIASGLVEAGGVAAEAMQYGWTLARMEAFASQGVQIGAGAVLPRLGRAFGARTHKGEGEPGAVLPPQRGALELPEAKPQAKPPQAKKTAAEFLRSLESGERATGEAEVVFLDACYIFSLAKAEVPIAEALHRLKQHFERETGKDVFLVLTADVYNEVKSHIRRKAGEKEEKVFTSENLADLHDAIYVNEYVELSTGGVGADTIKDLSGIMREKSEKGNRRVGAGEASIVDYMASMGRDFDYTIMSSDSDVSTLFKGTRVTVLGASP